MDHSRREAILEQVKRITLGRLHGKGARVYLFGSWARGEEKRSSDIDVAVELPDGAEGYRILASIREALEESTIPFTIDLVDLNAADHHFVNRVKEEGKLWTDLPSE